jgi:hypothetical protein
MSRLVKRRRAHFYAEKLQGRGAVSSYNVGTEILDGDPCPVAGDGRQCVFRLFGGNYVID